MNNFRVQLDYHKTLFGGWYKFIFVTNSPRAIKKMVQDYYRSEGKKLKVRLDYATEQVVDESTNEELGVIKIIAR